MSPISTTPPKYYSYSLDESNDKIIVDESLNFLYEPKNHPPLSFTETFDSMFNYTTLIMLIGFLAIYFIIYFLLGNYYGPFTPLKIIKGQAINFTCLILLIVGCLYFYYSLSKNNQDNFVRYTMLLFQDEMNDPNTIFIVMEFLIMFYVIVYLLGLPMNNNEKPFSLHIIELKSWLYLALLVIIMFFIYVLHIEIVDLVYFEFYRLLDIVNKYSPEEEIIKPKPSPVATPAAVSTPVANISISKKDTSTTAPPPSTKEQTCPSMPSDIKAGNKEVFNVSNNLYTYDDAQAICKAYGARLAKYDEIEEAYEAGAEWCNYGWSDGQMAYFPTQKSTWENLQKDPATKHNCGRPGINGGFINNPYIKFGVNCYGVKPPPNDLEKGLMNANMAKPAACPTAAPKDPNVEKWKQHLDSLVINSYNNSDWSQYS